MRTIALDLANLHPKAVKQMEEIARFLTKDKQTKQQDLTALSILANSFSVYYQAIEILQKEGITINESSVGVDPVLPGMEPKFIQKLRAMKPHPALKIANDAQYQITKLLIEFNLTPRSRKRIEPMGKDNDILSPADKLFSKAEKR